MNKPNCFCNPMYYGLFRTLYITEYKVAQYSKIHSVNVFAFLELQGSMKIKRVHDKSKLSVRKTVNFFLLVRKYF